jgi:hypothetical protein
MIGVEALTTAMLMTTEQPQLRREHGANYSLTATSSNHSNQHEKQEDTNHKNHQNNKQELEHKTNMSKSQHQHRCYSILT